MKHNLCCLPSTCSFSLPFFLLQLSNALGCILLSQAWWTAPTPGEISAMAQPAASIVQKASYLMAQREQHAKRMASGQLPCQHAKVYFPYGLGSHLIRDVTKSVFLSCVFLTVASLSFTGFPLSLVNVSQWIRQNLLAFCRAVGVKFSDSADSPDSCAELRFVRWTLSYLYNPCVISTSWSFRTFLTGGYFMKIPNLLSQKNFLYHMPLKTHESV